MKIAKFVGAVRIDWSALREVPPGHRGAPRGHCEGCGLYIWSEGGLKIPGVRGLFCSVLCLECGLFGPGGCRWCGAGLAGAGRFCSGPHRTRSSETRFGNGRRLLNFLSRLHPGPYRRLIGREERVTGPCQNCGGPLGGKNEGARFCSPACRQRSWRKSETPEKPQNGRCRTLSNQAPTGPEKPPKDGTVLSLGDLDLAHIRNGGSR